MTDFPQSVRDELLRIEKNLLTLNSLSRLLDGIIRSVQGRKEIFSNLYDENDPIDQHLEHDNKLRITYDLSQLEEGVKHLREEFS